jgi:hypothetical protein
MSADCPACKSNKSIPIFYGFPRPELSQRAEVGEVALADSPDWPDGPDRKCVDCGQRFFSNSAAQQAYDEETTHQLARLAAMKRGDYVLLDPRSMSAEEMANVIAKRYNETGDAKEPQSKKTPKDGLINQKNRRIFRDSAEIR